MRSSKPPGGENRAVIKSAVEPSVYSAPAHRPVSDCRVGSSQGWNDAYLPWAFHSTSPETISPLTIGKFSNSLRVFGCAELSASKNPLISLLVRFEMYVPAWIRLLPAPAGHPPIPL